MNYVIILKMKKQSGRIIHNLIIRDDYAEKLIRKFGEDILRL